MGDQADVGDQVDWIATYKKVVALRGIINRTTDAINQIERFYSVHPEYADLRIRPVTVEGNHSSEFFLGPSGRLYSIRTGNPASAPNNSFESINWLATKIRLERMFADGESNSCNYGYAGWERNM